MMWPSRRGEWRRRMESSGLRFKSFVCRCGEAIIDACLSERGGGISETSHGGEENIVKSSVRDSVQQRSGAFMHEKQATVASFLKPRPWRAHTSVAQSAVSYCIRSNSGTFYCVSLFSPSWFNEVKWDETHSSPQDGTKALPSRITGLELEQKRENASRLLFPAHVKWLVIRLCFYPEFWRRLLKTWRKVSPRLIHLPESLLWKGLTNSENTDQDWSECCKSWITVLTNSQVVVGVVGGEVEPLPIVGKTQLDVTLQRPIRSSDRSDLQARR